MLMDGNLHLRILRSFPFRIFSVNVTKSARNYRFSHVYTAQKMKFLDLVTFTEEILYGKLHFLYSEGYRYPYRIEVSFCTRNPRKFFYILKVYLCNYRKWISIVDIYTFLY